jgi:hypothetical protein
MREVLSIVRTDEIVRSLGTTIEHGEDLSMLLDYSEGMLTDSVCSFHDLVEVHFFCRAALTHLSLEYPHQVHSEYEHLAQRLRMKCYDLDDVLEWHMWRKEVIPSALERAREEWQFVSDHELDETPVLFEAGSNHWLDLVTPVLAHFQVKNWVRGGRPVLCAPAWFHSLLGTRIETLEKSRPYLFSQGAATGVFSRPLCSEAIKPPLQPEALELMKSDGLQEYSLQELREIVSAVYR